MPERSELPEHIVQMEDPKYYSVRLRRAVALLEPIAFSLEKNEISARDYADALYGALDYLLLLCDELTGSLRAL